MSQPIPLLSERVAAESAIAELNRGQPAAALKVLRRAMERRRRPESGLDRRSDGILFLRAHIEKAIVELAHNEPKFALRTLQLGLATKKQPSDT
jgi:hypothetical protein